MDRFLQQLTFWAVLFGVTASAVVAGLVLRRYAWDATEPIRFTDDINNAFRQGSAALRVGFIDRYDQDKTDPRGRYGWMPLDYAPGRLAVATLWAHWVRGKVDDPQSPGEPVEQWRSEFYDRARSLNQQYQLCEPMLMVNLTGEILSCIAIFCLVRRYMHSRNRPGPRDLLRQSLIGVIWAIAIACGSAYLLHWTGSSLLFIWQIPAIVWLWFTFPSRRATLSGVVAALFFWFDPALIWNAHAWPQWDSWVLPFFLWALLAASYDCWLIAGCLIAAGAMFKGQILFGAPIFLLWPFWQLRLIAIIRWSVGLAAATAGITAVWLVRTAGATPGLEFVPGHVNAEAVAWIGSMAIAFALMVLLLRYRWAWYAKLPVVAVVIGLISWHFFELDNTPQWLPGVWFTMAWAALVPALLWPKWAPVLKIPALVIATGIVVYELIGWSFHGLQDLDALLLIAGGFALGEMFFAGKNIRWRGRQFSVPANQITLEQPLAASTAWIKYTGRGVGLMLGLCLFLAPIPISFSPFLYAAAVVISGAFLFWCSFDISNWTWQVRLPLGWALTSLVLWPFLHLTQGLMIAAVAATLRVGLIIYYAPRRALPYTAAAWMAAALLLCIPLFDGSRTWFDTGLASPTTHFEAMASGANDNLADILSEEWDWQTMEPVITLGPRSTANSVAAFLTTVDAKYRHRPGEPVRLPLKYLLVSLWIIAVVLSSIGVAIQDHRRGPRFLVAIAAPWIAMFALLAQMHQRYLLWGATLSSASAALNPGYALLHFLLSIIAMSQEMQSMFARDRHLAGTFISKLIEGWHPGIGWAVLLTAIIYVYLAVRPIRSRNDGSTE